MGPKPFLMNQWYVCAREQEITRTPMTRWICGEPLVFFRRENGSAVALSDRCPHRKYPLSKGHLIHDEIECGYHGLRFGPDGACRLIPAQNEIPPGFGVHAYPLVEQYGMVFVWMGDRARADVSLIPNFFEAGGAGWACDHDYIHLDANWQLIIDNLLDLTHLTFVHKTTLASPGIQENPLTVTVGTSTTCHTSHFHTPHHTSTPAVVPATPHSTSPADCRCSPALRLHPIRHVHPSHQL